MSTDPLEPPRIDVSSVLLGADPALREALIVNVMARCRQYLDRPIDLWSALEAYALRRVVALAAAPALVASLIAIWHWPEPSASGIPAPIVRWMASSTMPSPVEVSVVLSELSR